MFSSKLRKALARGATLVAVSGVIAVAAPTAAYAACVPVMDPTNYPAHFDSATLNTSTGEIIWTWSGTGWSSTERCAGTMSVYVRFTDRSIVPAMGIESSGWVHLETDTYPDGMNYGYRGGSTSFSVQYRAGFTSPMRGTVGQITLETKAVFVAVGGPTTTLCNAHTTTFTSTPTGPQDLSDTPDSCLP